MRLDLYHAETARIAAQQSALLGQARAALQSGLVLNGLEQSGVLHALQVLIENAIGKAKHLIKAHGEPVPVSAYDALAVLARLGHVAPAALPDWNAVVGLRNRIVHDYMNLDPVRVNELVLTGRYQFVVDFLLQTIAPGSR